MDNIGTRPAPPDFSRLLSLHDAAEEWGIDDSTIRHAIRAGKLIPGYDCQKYGKQWVIDREAMQDLYGQPLTDAVPTP